MGKRNEILGKLATVDLGAANQIYSEIRALKLDLTFAVGGIKNHEIYFEHLGGAGGDPDGAIAGLIERDFGLQMRMARSARPMAGRGWAWTAYDWDEGKLFNYVGDAQNTFPVWNDAARRARRLRARVLPRLSDRSRRLHRGLPAEPRLGRRQRLGRQLLDSHRVAREGDARGTGRIPPRLDAVRLLGAEARAGRGRPAEGERERRRIQCLPRLRALARDPVALLDIEGFAPPRSAWAGGPLVGVLAAGAAMVGHAYPSSFVFRREGRWLRPPVARLALAPLAAFLCIAVWLIVFVATRYASLASLTTAAALVACVFVFDYPWPIVVSESQGPRRSSCSTARTSDGRSAAPSIASSSGAESPARGEPGRERRLARARIARCELAELADGPKRSATTSCTWIVSKLTCFESRKSPSSSWGSVSSASRRAWHGVLDEARLQVRVLDDEELVRTFEQVVDQRSWSARRRRRALPRRDPARCRRTASVARAGCASRSGRARGSSSTSSPSNPASSSARGAVAHEPLRARAGVDPGRLDADCPPRSAFDAAAMPHSVTISWQIRHRRAAVNRPLRADPDLGTSALALDDTARDVLREHLDEKRLVLDDELMASSKSSGNRDMWTPFWSGGEVDGAVDHRSHDRGGASTPDVDRLLHSRDARARQCERDLRRRCLKVVRELHAVRHAATVAACRQRKRRQPAVLEQATARLAARAVVDRVLLEVDARDGRPHCGHGSPSRLWMTYTTASPLPCSRSSSARVRSSWHRRRQPLDLLCRELCRRLERRELRAQQDLVRMRAPDAGERLLVAQERWSCLRSRRGSPRVRRRPGRARRPEVAEVLVELLGRHEPDARASSCPLR